MALFVIPYQCDATVEGGFPIDGDFIVAFESSKEVMGVFFSNILDGKVIHYK